ncbi:MAG: hypothetical protein IOC35_06565 [Methylobacterium sp.]|nr:hypothetical protein [Methylobacterium sp.]
MTKQSSPVSFPTRQSRERESSRRIKEGLDCRVSLRLPRNDAAEAGAIIMAGLSPSPAITGLAPVIQIPFCQFPFCRILGSRPGMIMVRP